MAILIFTLFISPIGFVLKARWFLRMGRNIVSVSTYKICNKPLTNIILYSVVKTEKQLKTDCIISL